MLNKLRQLLFRRFELPGASALERMRHRFSSAETVLFFALSLLLALGALILATRVNGSFLVTVPSFGGTLTEGIVGTPRFINPLLALADSDRDLVALIFSGLLKAQPDGTLIPDLAERYEIADGGLAYTFFLRKGLTFHDKEPITADDVLFTIQKAQDPSLKSPRRVNWEGVTAEKIDEKTVRLTLKQPYAPFLESVTLGILPKHLFEKDDAERFPFSQKNIDAVGSGPYQISRVLRAASGIPAAIELRAFKEYALGSPYLAKIKIIFYQNEKELLAAEARGEIESMDSLTPDAAAKLAEKGARLARAPLPRIFSVFFNQSQAPILAEKNVREALSLAIDKEKLVAAVLQGFGVPVDAPLPPFLLDNALPKKDAPIEERLKEANTLLEKAKLKMNDKTRIREKVKGKEVQALVFSLATSDVPELKAGAELLKEMWRDIGAEVKVEIYEAGDLNQNIIRPRKFDALLFGQVVGRDLDLFAFWHSSQRNDPGLNVSGYANAKVDKWLEEARREGDALKRAESFQKAVAAIRADTPAIFLYSPEFLYILPNKIKGFTGSPVATQSERFVGVHRWFIETEKVWSFLPNLKK